MPLAELALENLRCIQRVELDLAPGTNLVHGPNASGKTSLLEGIYLLGRGRSFRTRNSERLIRHEETVLRAAGRTAGALGQSIRVEVRRRARTSAELAGVPIGSLAQLAQAFPVQAIEPGIHKLLEEGSPRRRRWLDWAVFHVEPLFIDTWQRYARTVRQRNAALRTAPDTARAWDAELVRHGERVTAARRRLLDALKPYWDDTIGPLAGFAAELRYAAGWNADLSLAEAVSAAWPRDSRQGLSHAGPHRADVQVRVEGRAAGEVLSRGQQKLVATSMILAQLKMLRERADLVPTLLLDDPAAELDSERLARFVEQVRALQCQLVLTSLNGARALFGPPDRVFHVEQGRVKRA
ncbi:MAG TPA: DNA replication/repair protein RecF [Steroidobacteraceae bacterium]|jgi:DNA replication and repair protein RecF|nr:DNA replication/repair protein RecF [Steroidobacteraceae bacterium]